MRSTGAFLTETEYSDRLDNLLDSLELHPSKRALHHETKKAENKQADLRKLDEIIEAIKQDQFTFYLQPQVNSETHSIIGMEALVRWVHPERGIVSPGEFIPVLEKSGLIVALDMKIWEKVCKTLGSWVAKGQNVVPISINVSIKDIEAIDVADYLENLCKKYKVPRKMLRIEITESMMAQSMAELSEFTSKLHKGGYKVLMDDFGSGYSSLNMLKDTNVDVIKLDMKLIELNNENFERGRRIVESVVEMSHQMGLPVVAEGVENTEQLRMLQSLDCIYTQGFKFYRPMPIENAEVLLEQPGTKAYWDLALDSEGRDVKEIHFQFLQNLATHACYLLSDYLILFGRVNVITGDFELINRNPVFPAPSGGNIGNLQKYVDTCLEMGLIAPEFEREFKERSNVERASNLILSGSHERLFTVRTTLGGDLEWITIGFTSTKDCSPQAPWGVFFVRRETFNTLPAQVLGQSYEFDTLTGLFNVERYKNDLREIPLKDYNQITCVYMDVIGLHEVNNHMGHQAGDEMLESIGRELRYRFPESTHYRLGGDEFLVIATDMGEKTAAKQVERARRNLGQSDIEISCGIATSDKVHDTNSLKELVALAEHRMFDNKRMQYAADGKGRQLRVLDQRLEEMMQEKEDVEQSFSMILPNCTGVYVVNMLDDSMRCVRAPEGFKLYGDKPGATFSESARNYTYDSILPKYQQVVLDLLDYDVLRDMIWKGQEIKRYYERKDGTCFDLEIYPYSKDSAFKDFALWVFTSVPRRAD